METIKLFVEKKKKERERPKYLAGREGEWSHHHRRQDLVKKQASSFGHVRFEVPLMKESSKATLLAILNIGLKD